LHNLIGDLWKKVIGSVNEFSFSRGDGIIFYHKHHAGHRPYHGFSNTTQEESFDTCFTLRPYYDKIDSVLLSEIHDLSGRSSLKDLCFYLQVSTQCSDSIENLIGFILKQQVRISPYTT